MPKSASSNSGASAVLVDDDDGLGRLHAGPVLDRAGDADARCRATARPYGRSDRPGRVWSYQPASVTARDAPSAAPSRSASASTRREALRAAEAATAGDDDVGVGQVGPVSRRSRAPARRRWSRCRSAAADDVTSTSVGCDRGGLGGPAVGPYGDDRDAAGDRRTAPATTPPKTCWSQTRSASMPTASVMTPEPEPHGEPAGDLPALGGRDDAARRSRPAPGPASASTPTTGATGCSSKASSSATWTRARRRTRRAPARAVSMPVPQNTAADARPARGPWSAARGCPC